MTVLEFLQQRRSTPSRLLGEPGPDAAQRKQILELALRVPDHGRLTPWRLLLIEGSARAHLGEQLVRIRTEREPDIAQAHLDKDRQRFNHAPLVVVVIAQLQRGHKIPEQEQLLSGGAVCFQMLLAARALGFGAQWLTGWAAYDDQVQALLGLSKDECILGFIHIGSAAGEANDRPRPALQQHLTHWKP